MIKAVAWKKENYNELTAELDNYLKPLTEGNKYGSRAFYSRVLMQGESVVSHFDDLQKLALEICPDENNPMNDQQLVMAFIRSLPRHLQEKVISKEPMTCRDALQ